jgi:CheY-like chemotaxis protein
VDDCPDNRDSLALLLRAWGYDVCTAQGGPLLLIAVTGYGREPGKARSCAAGFDAHLTKPAEPDELRRLRCSAAPPRNSG